MSGNAETAVEDLPATDRPRPLVVAGSRLLPEATNELAGFAEIRVNTEEDPWDQDRLRRAAADADALIAFMPDRIDADFLAACPRLRCIAGALKGADNIDLTACATRGIRVSVVEDLLSAPTAELGLGLLIGLIRMILPGDRAVRRGHSGWLPTRYGTSVVGGRVGILGMGGLGQAFARLLRGFTSTVVYHDPRRLPAEVEADLGLTWVAAEDLPGASATALVLSAPLTGGTRHWLNAARLARLPAGAVVVNIGRGSVVDEAAVMAALARGSLAGYAADVFAFEDQSIAGRPSRVAPDLLAHPRTLFTPHLGSAVESVRLAIELAAIAALRRNLASAGAAGRG